MTWFSFGKNEDKKNVPAGKAEIQMEPSEAGKKMKSGPVAPAAASAPSESHKEAAARPAPRDGRAPTQAVAKPPQVKDSAKPLAKEPPAFVCPDCGDALEKTSYGNQNVARCPICGAYWCPGNSLLHMAKNPVEEIEPLLLVKLKVMMGSRLAQDTPEATGHRCPQCGEALLSFHYKKISGIKVEKCKQGCGFFVDKRDVEKIQGVEKLSPSQVAPVNPVKS